MEQKEILENLNTFYTLLKDNKEGVAKSYLLGMHIVDTPNHLALPKTERHLFWDLYEYLVLGNVAYADKERLILDLEAFLHKKNLP